MQTAIKLQEQVEFLQEALDEKNTLIEAKNRYILQLEEWIKTQRQKTFGASSERISPDQLGLFNEAEALELAPDIEEDCVTVASHVRNKKPRVSIPAELPREEVVYDLADEDKVCPYDGAELTVIGSDDHEQLDIIPAQIKVIRHKRLKYACPCCEQHVVTAQKPKQPIEKSIASPGLLAFVATQKYGDALPLYRQSEMFKRIGIALDRSNLATWMIKSGELIQPLVNLLRDQLQERPLVHMDETTLQVLNEPGKNAQSNSYLWLMASFTGQPM
jgi:transposase